jgi:hypothetical protein
MHRFRSWTLGTPEWRTERNRLLPIAGGVSPTLNIDFSTGTLDTSLFTFTRTSTATFIDSNGYVTYALCNIVRNSEWVGTNSNPTNWTQSVTGSGSITIPSTGTRNFAVTTSGYAFITDGNTGIIAGLTYTAVVEVTSVTGSPTMTNVVVATGSPTNQTWYQDGIAVTSSTVVQPGVISYVFTAGTTGSIVRMGVGTTGSSVTNQSVTLQRPRFVPSIQVGVAYLASTTSAGAYNTPRFEYSNGSPVGLLIENQVTNKIQNSNVTGTYWAASPSAVVTYASGITPKNTTESITRIKNIGTGGANSSFSVYQIINVSASTDYVFSFWAKLGSSTGAQARYRVYGLSPGTASSIIDHTASTSIYTTKFGVTADKWTRIYVTFNSRSYTQIIVYPASSESLDTDVYVWGVQVEPGTYPTSFIETGTTTTTTRTQDKLSFNNLNWLSSSSGTMYCEWDINNISSTTNNYLIQLSNTSGSDKISFGNKVEGAATTTISEAAVTGGVTTRADTLITIDSTTTNTLIKSAFEWSSSSLYAATNNSGGAEQTNATLPTVPFTKVQLGNDTANTDTNTLNGHIKKLIYWPTYQDTSTTLSYTGSSPFIPNISSNSFGYVDQLSDNFITFWSNQTGGTDKLANASYITATAPVSYYLDFLIMSGNIDVYYSINNATPQLVTGNIYLNTRDKLKLGFNCYNIPGVITVPVNVVNSDTDSPEYIISVTTRNVG